MTDALYRLGDLIDDWCPRCRLLLNHAVASMVDEHVVKVICQTCYSEHAYLHGKERKKKPSGRTTLFDQVLAKMGPTETGPGASSSEKRPAEPARYIRRHKRSPRTKKP